VARSGILEIAEGSLTAGLGMLVAAVQYGRDTMGTLEFSHITPNLPVIQWLVKLRSSNDWIRKEAGRDEPVKNLGRGGW
jgi:hypothetical protein